MDLLIDSHAHLTDKAFAEDLEAVLERAALVGIERIVTIAETLRDAERAADLARRFDAVISTAGVHPHKASEWSAESGARLASLLGSGSFVAVGEIGLDFHYNFSTPDEQRRAFREQLQVAKDKRLPVVVHCRNAYPELIETLEIESPFPAGGVIHCYSGNMAEARRLVAMGFHIGITGVVTFKKAGELRRIVAEAVPLERLLVETDCPYLAPEPYRGKRNEPAFVVRTAEKIAEVLSLSFSEVSAATRQSTVDLMRF